MDETTAAKLAIQEVVNAWVIWSDSGDWERFATVWHDDAWMTAPGSPRMCRETSPMRAGAAWTTRLAM